MEAKKYCYFRVDAADNGGLTISYDEKIKNGTGVYDGYTSIPRSLSYGPEQKNEAMQMLASLLDVKIEISQEKKEEGKSVEVEIKGY